MKPRLYVLDTNVLMHDPAAIFRFDEHDLYIPMIVLEELDAAKKGMSEVARNARQVSRFLNQLMAGADRDAIERGLPLPSGGSNHGHGDSKQGRLWFQTRNLPIEMPDAFPKQRPDNNILGTVASLSRSRGEVLVTLVSKDINLRIKAAVLGIHAEDYHHDQVLTDVDLLYTGIFELPVDFWDQHGDGMESWQERDRSFYRVTGPLVKRWLPNQCLYLPGETEFGALVRSVAQDSAVIEVAKDYRSSQNMVWGVSARNMQQDFALNLLMDPAIDFVSLVGAAGTGKTLLTLAAGLTQTLEDNRYQEIIVTRVTVPVGEDIGFLPGTEEEKMTPWMGALMDNLEVLTASQSGGGWGRAATNDLLQNRIRIRSLNFMRGRTLLNKFLILDEAQNLTSPQMKTLITRAGPGTKVVCLGNVAQIDTPYLTETTSGLTNVVDRFKKWAHSGHITLLRGERSRLADFASESL